MLSPDDYADMIGGQMPQVENTPRPIGLVRAALLAEYLAVSTDVVSTLARAGTLTRESAPGIQGAAYDLKTAVGEYCAHLRAKGVVKARQVATPEMESAKLDLVQANARKVELQNDKTAGRLIPAQEVRAEWLAVAADLRSRLLAVPGRVAARLSLDRTTAAALDREIRAAMAELATSEGSAE